MTPPRGRPVDPAKQAEQKQNLLIAARQLMSEKTYRSITIRELGERAGVNSAMVKYYFENKEGLFIALLDHMANEHFSRVTQLASAENPIKALIQNMLAMLSDNKGLARMIHDEILHNDSVLRDAFIERFPKRMSQFLPMLIQRELAIDNPLTAKYLAFNLISLIITPYIGEPVRKMAWKISDEELTQPEWAEHIYQFFINGSSSFTSIRS
ncbi:MAG: TetR/AcrR family transcriptional regulator [Kangiellaceae bacterium]|nr:TetR/AcrR family transcriptional regulator [Kangiellaceae bacterium]